MSTILLEYTDQTSWITSPQDNRWSLLFKNGCISATPHLVATYANYSTTIIGGTNPLYQNGYSSTAKQRMNLNQLTR